METDPKVDPPPVEICPLKTHSVEGSPLENPTSEIHSKERRSLETESSEIPSLKIQSLDTESLETQPLETQSLETQSLKARSLKTLNQIKINQQEVKEYEYDSDEEPVSLDKIPNKDYLRLPTQKLAFGCEFGITRNHVCSILELRANGLEKLSLSLAPTEKAFCSFPCDVLLSTLTNLHLWGNVTTNLNFLKLMPALKVLTWNTTCYDEKTYGYRHNNRLGQKTNILLIDDIVNNTDELDDFRLESLQSLELYGGVLSKVPLTRLGTWLPNVSSFGATVFTNTMLYEILAQWTNLEHLELKHGSRITAVNVIYAYLNLGAFQNLQSFKWKWCPCLEGNLRLEDICAVHFLKKTCGNNVVHPWILSKPERERAQKKTECLQALFEVAVVTGREQDADTFRSAFATCQSATQQ